MFSIGISLLSSVKSKLYPKKIEISSQIKQFFKNNENLQNNAENNIENIIKKYLFCGEQNIDLAIEG